MTSYTKDIYPLFTDKHVRGMSKFFDLRSFGDVKARSKEIFDRIRGIGGSVMPPPPPYAMVLGRKRRSIYLKRR